MKSVYSLHTYGGKETSLPNRFYKLFDLHDDEKIHAYLMKLSNNTHSDFELSYQTVMNNQRYTIVQGLLNHVNSLLETYQQ